MQELVFQTMVSGSYFGEVDVIFNNPRSYTAMAAIQSELFSVERNKYIDILDSYPEIADEVLTFAKVRRA